MKLVFIALASLVVFPSVLLAAGFAKESLFLSKNSVMEGDAVLIHTVVSNEAPTKFSGTLTLNEKDVKVGAVPVTLAAEEVRVVSLPWKPVAGSHTIDAVLTDAGGDVVEKTTATFHINEKPKPASESSSNAGTVSSSQDIQNQIANISPGAAQAAAPVFATVDSLRTKLIDVIDSGVEWSKQQTTAKPGSTLGTSTTKEEGGFLKTISTIFATILLYVLSVLRYVIANAGIFYPLLALLFFYALWKTYKRMRRPKYAGME